jgi:hypothetical protein
MFALSSLVSYVDYILNLDNKDAENVNYYVNMVILFSKELGKNMKYNFPFEDYDYSTLDDDFSHKYSREIENSFLSVYNIYREVSMYEDWS